MHHAHGTALPPAVRKANDLKRSLQAVYEKAVPNLLVVGKSQPGRPLRAQPFVGLRGYQRLLKTTADGVPFPCGLKPPRTAALLPRRSASAG